MHTECQCTCSQLDAFSIHILTSAHVVGLHSSNMHLSMLQVLELPKTLHDDIAEQHVFLLIGSQAGQQHAQLLPSSPESQAFLRSLPTDVFFWQEERAAGLRAAKHKLLLMLFPMS